MCLPAAALVLASCKPADKAEAPQVRPVRTVIAARAEAGETVVLIGRVQAQDEAALAFRIAGRVVERPVNVGDRVEAGQVLARLDPENEVNAPQSTRSALAAARAQLAYARSAFERQRQLLAQGHTTRSQCHASLTDDPIVKANGRARIVAPQAGG